MKFLPAVIIFPVWAILGLFFWVALLVRAFFVYFLTLSTAIIGGGETRGLSIVLYEAAAFYPEVFKQIWRSFEEGSPNEPRERIGLGKAIVESCYTLLFWAITAFAFFGSDGFSKAWDYLGSPFSSSEKGVYDTYDYSGFDYGSGKYQTETSGREPSTAPIKAE